ncbi:MAG: hypothetical protein JW901_01060 [Dehalococcoidia bacterium]|nr:hypothetical protein [Dehalococcoidia bacterium]
MQNKWFERHLNWSMILGWILAVPLGWAMAFIAGICWATAILLFNVENPSEQQLETVGVAVFLITATVFSLAVTIWACIQKGRSWCWALLYPVPFGWIVLLALENRRTNPASGLPPVAPPNADI